MEEPKKRAQISWARDWRAQKAADAWQWKDDE